MGGRAGALENEHAHETFPILRNTALTSNPPIPADLESSSAPVATPAGGHDPISSNTWAVGVASGASAEVSGTTRTPDISQLTIAHRTSGKQSAEQILTRLNDGTPIKSLDLASTNPALLTARVGQSGATKDMERATRSEPLNLKHIQRSDSAESDDLAPAQAQVEIPATSSTASSHQVERSDQQKHDTIAQQQSQEPAVQPQPHTIPASADHGGFTTQTAPPIAPDYDISDEAYAESISTSYVSSIASEVSKGFLENERLYPSYGQHRYGMPVDEGEMDRMDLQHRKYELVLGGKHFLAPIGPTPQRILDLGTGTGIWALDVADMFPSAQVIGNDIALIQPKWVAANCQFEIDDVEEEWMHQKNSFDFIHFRDPLFVVRDWPKLMRQIYEHTKPGGWCELAAIYPVVMCDDGTMPPDSAFKAICDKLMEATALFGTPADCVLSFAKYLGESGFIDVSENIFKVPSSPWPKDRKLKQIGALEMTNVIAGATAFGLRAFEQVFGWSKEQTEVAMVNFRRDVQNREYHQYCQYFVVYGRKPPLPGDDTS